MCGKNYVWIHFSSCSLGSPPRVREEPLVTLFHLSNSRITPACAGRTGRGLFGGLGDEDHPRVCGKNMVAKLLHPSNVGSPPRVREEPIASIADQQR